MAVALTAAQLALCEAYGRPYSWGAGTPATAWPWGEAGQHGGEGYDCSGYAQGALVRLGKLSPDAPDRTAQDLCDLAVAMKPHELETGDLVFYGVGRVTHVDVVLGPIGSESCMLIGAMGGGRDTNGDDPEAKVNIRPFGYRSDVVKVGRIDGKPLDFIRSLLVTAWRRGLWPKLRGALASRGFPVAVLRTLETQLAQLYGR